MPDWLAIALIAVVSALTGWLVIRPFLASAPFARDWLALLLASLTVGTVAISLVALSLAELGVYSLAHLGVLIGWKTHPTLPPPTHKSSTTWYNNTQPNC